MKVTCVKSMWTTTLAAIREERPCKKGWGILLESLEKTEADDEPITLKRIRESNGVLDAIWCIRVFKSECHRDAMVQFACDLAELLLPQWRTYAEIQLAEELHTLDTALNVVRTGSRPLAVGASLTVFEARAKAGLTRNGYVPNEELDWAMDAADAAYTAACVGKMSCPISRGAALSKIADCLQQSDGGLDRRVVEVFTKYFE